MRVASLISIALFGPVVLLGCNQGKANDTPASGASAGAPSSAAPAPSATSDPDQAANGAGVPSGYVGRTDGTSASINDVKYTTAPGGGWEVKTGPAHILYKQGDSASGSYVLRTEIDQLASPRHPEAYGVFFGGQDLAGPSERYTYFLVRGNGMYAIKARNGADASTVVNFTASPNVPKADASGKASYAITVRVAPDSIHFLVNDKPVAAIAAAAGATKGIAGIRVNHNLDVMVKPLEISH